MVKITNITPIEYLKGVGPRKGELLRQDLGVSTIGELLNHYPFRYIDRTEFHKIRQVDGNMSSVQVLGRLVDLREIGEGRSRRLIGRLVDDTGSLELVWFQSVAWLKKSLKVQAVYIVYGKPSLYNQSLSITHPEMELYQSQEKVRGIMSLQPVYSTTERLKKSSLDTKGIQGLQEAALSTIYSTIEETLPDYLMQRFRLISFAHALRAIHFPNSPEELHQARRRLKFEELFFIQLKLLRTKQLNTLRFKGHIFSAVGDFFHTFYNENFPSRLRVLKKEC